MDKQYHVCNIAIIVIYDIIYIFLTQKAEIHDTLQKSGKKS